MENLVKIIRHSDLSQADLLTIVKLKMQHWHFEESEQIKWIDKNISSCDYHLLITNNESVLIGYLNMVRLNVQNDKNKRYLGIGNVCVNKSYKSLGYGLLLMNIVNIFINQNNFLVILLCKDALSVFYKKAGWYLFEGIPISQNKEYKDLLFSTSRL